MKKKIIFIFCAIAFIAVLVGAFTFTASADGEHTCTGKVKVTLMINDYCLVAQCRRCREYIYPQQVSIDMEDGASFCPGGFEIKVKDTGWSEISKQNYVVLYEGDGDTVYELSSVPPTNLGDYVVYITLESTWEQGADAVEDFHTTPVHFTLGTHDWEYTSDDRSIYAKCKHCTESASVTLDASAIFEANHNEDYDAAITQDVFYENNWSNQLGIAHYAAAYKGTYIGDDDEEHSFASHIRPYAIGNYTVSLSVNDGDKTVSTQEMPFYVTGIPLSQCEVVEYTEEEIAAFTEPVMYSDGYYHVETLSELLWCTYWINPEFSMVIVNDIIVNPITVLEDGTVMSASKTVHVWRGFGRSGYEYKGEITGSFEAGSRHTIYGLYISDDEGKLGGRGLVNVGTNCRISRINVEDSFLQDSTKVSAFIGYLNINSDVNSNLSNNNDYSVGISECNSANNVITSTELLSGCAAGFIAYINTDSDSVGLRSLYVTDCINDSSVTGNMYAGGIIGTTYHQCNTAIKNCKNYGTVKASNGYAAGIVANMSLASNSNEFRNSEGNTEDQPGGYTERKGNQTQASEISDCINTGYISGKAAESGIVGCYYTEYDGLLLDAAPFTGVDTEEFWTFWHQWESYPTSLKMSNVMNVGELDSVIGSDNMADIISLVGSKNYHSTDDDYSILITDNIYYVDAENAFDPKLAVTPDATRLTRAQIRKGQACTLFGCHTESAHCSDITMGTCTTPGSKTMHCEICDAVMSSEVIPLHGHYDIDGKCIYCGTTENLDNQGLFGSIFSAGSWVFMGMVVLALVGAAVAIIIIKKKKKKTQAED